MWYNSLDCEDRMLFLLEPAHPPLWKSIQVVFWEEMEYMISYQAFYRAPSLLPGKQDHTLSAIAFYWIAPGLSIKLGWRNVCFGSTFSHNVILIAAKSLQNWQDDKSLAGNILSLPYLALHVTSNTDWHQSYISLCVCACVHTSPVVRPCQSVSHQLLQNLLPKLLRLFSITCFNVSVHLYCQSFQHFAKGVQKYESQRSREYKREILAWI